MIKFIKNLSELKQALLGLVLILILGAITLNWYTDGKIKNAFVKFGNKQIELIKGDKDAVDKVDGSLGDDSILDRLLPKGTSSRQERSKIDHREVSDTYTKEAYSGRIHTDSRERAKEAMPDSGLAEQSEEDTTDTSVLSEEMKEQVNWLWEANKECSFEEYESCSPTYCCE